MEILLVELPPSDTSDIAYRVASTTTNPCTTKNDTHANVLRAAIEQTGVQDPEAAVLLDLYENGVVTNANRVALKAVFDALDPADTLSGALLTQYPDPKTQTPLEAAFSNARYGIDFENDVFFTNDDGLTGLPDAEGNLKVHSVEITSSFFGESDPVTIIAREMGLSHWTEQIPLRWTRDGAGNLLPVQSDYRHTALGYIGTNGQFEHERTVLDENHPARRP